MKTVMANAQTVQRDWVLVDAADMPLGRVASQVAALLRGKNKTNFTAHCDTGDYVIVINTDKIILTGKKMEQKRLYRHSGYPGGLKSAQYKDVMAKRSDMALEIAVKGMLPHNKLADQMIKKLKCYKGAEHPHAAQQPKVVTLQGQGGAR